MSHHTKVKIQFNKKNIAYSTTLNTYTPLFINNLEKNCSINSTQLSTFYMPSEAPAMNSQ